MEEIIKKMLSGDLKELSGLKINGRVPLSTQLINEVISQFLHPETLEEDRSAGPSPDGASRKTTFPEGENINLPALLRKHMKTLEVNVEEGKIVVDFYLQVD